MKGLCVFCGEQETPYHRLQHKNDVILMIDSEDHLSDSMVNKIGNPEEQALDDGELVETEFVTVNEVKMEKQKQRKCSKCWMFKFRKGNIDQWLGGYNLIATYLENKKTWMFKYKAPKDTKVLETSGQCIRKRGSVSADRESESNQPTLRFPTWVIVILLNHYMVLIFTPVAYAIHFLGGVGKDKKQSHLSLWINRVWDPGRRGRSLVKDASYSTRIFSSLPATVPVSLLCQESLANQITSFSTNLVVKVSLKGEDVIQDKRREQWHVCN